VTGEIGEILNFWGESGAGDKSQVNSFGGLGEETTRVEVTHGEMGVVFGRVHASRGAHGKHARFAKKGGFHAATLVTRTGSG